MHTILRHVVIIPDGNRRWARQRGMQIWQGHRKGFDRIKELLKVAREENIKFVSFWALSVDNLNKRSKKELNFIFSHLDKKISELAEDEYIHTHKVKIRVLGYWEEYAPSFLQKTIIRAQNATKDYGKYNLTLFLIYDGRKEMLHAVRKLSGTKSDIGERQIKKNLLTKELPPVDLLIRTGGEPYLSSGFMMWDIADAQLYFTEKYFPDFGKKELRKAIKEYRKRIRRFGA